MQVGRRRLVGLSMRYTRRLVKLVAVGASKMLRGWSMAPRLVAEGWSGQVRVRVRMVAVLERRRLVTLRHHVHHVTHGGHGVVDGHHSRVVLLEMMAQCLFGSLRGGTGGVVYGTRYAHYTRHLLLHGHMLSRCPLHGGVWQGAR